MRQRGERQPADGVTVEQGTVDWFRPTSGRVMGVLGLLMAAGVGGLGVVDLDGRTRVLVVSGAILAGVLVWAALLRPRVGVQDRDLVLRSMLQTVRVPLAAVEELAVRQVLAVRVGERRLVSSAIGRPLRQVVRPRPAASTPTHIPSYADFVEERLRQHVDEARAQLGIKRYSDDAQALARDVRRVPAWPEIVTLSLSAVLFLVALAL